jgi:methyl-accepting chemotaxis protein
VGYDPETGEPQIPWLESSIYEGWQKSGLAKWTDFVKDQPIFHEQSRTKRPAFALTKAGLVGLDGRYLNNAPQCTGWMDLTKNGGSGSFYILWSGLYKLTTAAAIPYYTGQYAPSEANAFSRRGFGIVTIGSGLDHFTRPVRDTEARLAASIESNLRGTMSQLIITTMALSVIVVLIAIWLARYISRPINVVSRQLSLLAIGEISSLPSDLPTLRRRDEIGMLAHSMQNLIESRREELDMVNAIAMGDYTRSIALRSEFDRLGKALNTMIRTNKNTLTQVNRAVEEVGDRAEAVSQVSASLSQDVETSEKAAASISETIDSVDRQAKDNAASAKNANHLAVAGCDAANRGYAAVTKLAGSMTEIRQSGNKIASVAKLIDDIAFQTNLLALNASVEAARAGRQGKGFSVVADEVRNLSARSAKAARETGVMVESMLKLMDEGTKLAERSDHEFREIVDTISQVAKLFASISDASNAQSSDMSQIVNGLNQISDVIQRNSNGAKQMAESANTLSRQAEDLRLMVSRFRLNTSNTSSNSRFLELSHPRNTP